MPKSLPNSTVKVKRATAARWASQNPVLAAGEIGYETDTRKMKLGDGTSSWTQLSYLVADGTGTGTDTGTGGQAATIRIGTVTTLRYNQNATVVNSGTSTAAVLDFGIPRGKSVYEYAVEGGYEGTEQEFGQLIEDLLAIQDGNEVEY
jgi:hypothetical protein